MYSFIHARIEAALQSAPVLTFGGAGSSFLFWGLHISEVGVIVSSMAAVCGVLLQTYVVIRSVRNEKLRQIEIAAETVRAAAELAQKTAELAAHLVQETKQTAAKLKNDTADIAETLKRETNGSVKTD
jgi:hypothetical protein